MGECACPWGCTCLGGVPAQGGVLAWGLCLPRGVTALGGGVSQHALRHTHFWDFCLFINHGASETLCLNIFMPGERVEGQVVHVSSKI